MTDIDFSCDCGKFKATLNAATPAVGSHIVCYCNDCQAFAATLDRIDHVLDDNGGTPIFQTSPSRLRVRQGIEHLTALRLTGGPLLRWYTSCCHQPIGNTLNSTKLPFIGLIALAKMADDPEAAKKALGPSMGGIYTESSWRPYEGKRAFMPGLLVAMMKRLLGTKFAGKSLETPLFNDVGEPIVDARRVSKTERAQADQLLAARR
ncbi:MAG: DUF6151 family protein [Pseudomonadota bacterium]